VKLSAFLRHAFLTLNTKPKPLGQIAYEAVTKNFTYKFYAHATWDELPTLTKKRYSLYALAVAREVNKRGKAKVIKLLGKALPGCVRP